MKHKKNNKKLSLCRKKFVGFFQISDQVDDTQFEPNIIGFLRFYISIFLYLNISALKSPCFGQIICAAGKILKKLAKKGVFRLFLKNVDQKITFLPRALPPSKLVYIGVKGTFRHFLGSVTKHGCLRIVQRGALWVGRGSNP